MTAEDPFQRLGVVVIGRNEGERLRVCLAALAGSVALGVYVDSGSTDGSCELARSFGFEVVDLDTSLPFTAARARNAGVERLVTLRPDLELVQFVDGDCELREGWLGQAVRELAADPTLGAVCGRLRERHPEASIYNQLCDLEWDQPPGETSACGGIAMLRLAPLRAIGGFNPAVLAGEEAEMYRRLRGQGFRVRRLPVEMALHDVDIRHFGQWWRRTVRSGHAYAEVHELLRGAPSPLFAHETRSNWLWGAVLPGTILFTSAFPPLALALSLAYPVLFWRVYSRELKKGRPESTAALQASFIVLGKVPSALGQAMYLWNKVSGRRFTYAKSS